MKDAPGITRDEADVEVATKMAPKVTRESMEARIRGVRYFVDETLTVAVVTVENGFKLVGTSAAASPANFDRDIGERYAFEDAVRQMWPLEGYLLRERLAGAEA